MLCCSDRRERAKCCALRDYSPFKNLRHWLTRQHHEFPDAEGTGIQPAPDVLRSPLISICASLAVCNGRLYCRQTPPHRCARQLCRHTQWLDSETQAPRKVCRDPFQQDIHVPLHNVDMLLCYGMRILSGSFKFVALGSPPCCCGRHRSTKHAKQHHQKLHAPDQQKHQPIYALLTVATWDTNRLPSECELEIGWLTRNWSWTHGQTVNT